MKSLCPGVCAQPQMSYILTYVRGALPTSDVQSILEISATDEIQLEDQNQTCQQLHLYHVVPEQLMGE